MPPESCNAGAWSARYIRSVNGSGRLFAFWPQVLSIRQFVVPAPFPRAPLRYVKHYPQQAQMQTAINFYLVNEPYGEFSNFAAFPIEIDGRVWPTSEHYFQAQKYFGTVHEEDIRLADSPMKASKMGRDRSRPLRVGWETVKDDVMRKAIRAKFAQHKFLHDLLLSTGKFVLVEHTKNDSYWGDGGDGSGANMLGRLLMELRDELES